MAQSALTTISRAPVVRGRSGRPIQTAPLPIGTEQAILEKGYARATGPRIPDDMRAKIEQALAENDYYHYGLRVHDNPLKVGETAPPSRQYFEDFIEGDPTFGHHAYPHHDTQLPGASTMGLRSSTDIEHALRRAEVLPQDYLAGGPYGWGYYPGKHVSLLRSDRRFYGNDPGEWILPDAEVVATWAKAPPPRQAMARVDIMKKYGVAGTAGGTAMGSLAAQNEYRQ